MTATMDREEAERVVLCRNCAGQGWVCENHRDQPWENDGGTCCGGAGAPCPVCQPEMACAPYSASRTELEAARALAVIDQTRANADRERIHRLEGAIQAMAALVQPLKKQGEDRIWRPVRRLLDIADAAILDRWPAPPSPVSDSEE